MAWDAPEAFGTPGTFQDMVNRLTGGLSNVCICIDDVIVSDRDPAAHIVSLRPSLILCNTKTSKVPPLKLVSVLPPTTFTISPHGLPPHATDVTGFFRKPMPTNASQLRSPLGGISYYRRLLPDFAQAFSSSPSPRETRNSLRFHPRHEGSHQGHSFGPQ